MKRKPQTEEMSIAPFIVVNVLQILSETQEVSISNSDKQLLIF